MAEVSALRKHPCPECAGDAEWNASKQALVCPYCGTLVPWSDGENPMGAAIVEHDLNETLAHTAGDEHEPNSEKKSVQCESCRAISVFDADRAAQRCDFCGSPAIVPADDLPDTINPESLLPAVIPNTQVRDQLHKWYRSRWWAPNKLKRSALTDTLQGIYLPYWTFDAHVDARWTAQSGYYYYETRRARGSDGKMTTRRVRKTRWKPSSGNLSQFFDDDPVPGTIGLHYSLLRKIEPFPTLTDLKPYDPAYVRGWTVERYKIGLQEASETSKSQMDKIIHQLCARDVPGDTHRNLQVSSNYQGRTFKHILVPVWLVRYTYGPNSFQIVVNGYTGKMAGEYPKSWVKITLAALTVILLVLFIIFLANR